MEGKNFEQRMEESNRSKYGDKNHDLIAENYRISKHDGDVWCANNTIKYLNRFKREGSSKANNMTDLYKSRDYLNRMIEANEKLVKLDKPCEIVE